MANLLNGTFSLIREPFNSYQRGENIVHGTLNGMKYFA